MNKILFYLLLIVSINIYGQGSTYKPIGIKSRVPSLTIGNVFPNLSKSISFQEFHGKWVILDFWNIHCGACIQGIPKVEVIQERFKEKVQVIMVTYNTAQEVKNLFRRLNKPLPTVSMIVADKKLQQLFPHQAEPHHVWIDPEGTVKYIAQGFNTSIENVSAVLDGKDVQLMEKAELPGFDDKRELISYGTDVLTTRTKAYSILMKGLAASVYSNRIQVFKDSITGKPARILALNTPLLRLYSLAYNRRLFGIEINPFQLPVNNRIFLEVKDTIPFFETSDSTILDRWLNDNWYTYELKIPHNSIDDAYLHMQSDLNNMLDYTAVIEKRKLKCLVLVRTSAEHKLRTQDTSAKPGIKFKEDGIVSIRNMTIHSSLYPWLVTSNFPLTTPVIDDTQFDLPVDMDLACKLADLPALQNQLQLYGLDLIEDYRNVDVLVIKDKMIVQDIVKQPF